MTAYVDCVLDEEYEILNEYPFTIRKKSNGRVIKECDNGDGYIRVTLNGVKHLKHRIVAIQFLPNEQPLLKTEVDHINRNRSDYHIENLRWVSPRENQLNKSSHMNVDYEYVDYKDLPDDLIEVSDYGVHRLEGYYYSEETDLFYFDNGVNTRILHINYKRNGVALVNTKDVNGCRVKICYLKFKKIYGFL